MNKTKPLILVLDLAGTPRKWIDFEKAAYYHCKDLISWTAGHNEILVNGGVNRLTGNRVELGLNSIIALRGARPSKRVVPLITNSALFGRDGYQCAYCGEYFSKQKLTRDHYIAKANGGKDVWDNVVTACRSCNNRKGHRCESEYSDGMYFKPYVPSLSEHLLLTNRQVLDDQFDFLTKSLSRSSRYTEIYQRPMSDTSDSNYRILDYVSNA